ncbi:MAG: 50S ribosomal protein L22 [Parcubacteria group bacterium GW2011_GWC2_42_12]|uniref:Large ribosomal subunit protein uL22 n=2 Tax=Candidatus Falkowiibacteriota TaxID=1752728 RepID=A0A1F5S788_9BACT|nr:MAG: 50S ribosomal protein L22 [Candidatus Falkowbacteria bacterium GW2011_GWA2_41_14]KKS35144.1 MAG: 50S ribosomal protein L22 [Parcubacteria group bacterium GW2011_GWC2_42_12]OGF22529.1 MAG: 50S ribosomal protein L22 [Candidatus Falkowbacteria bacterium RIFCSPHIGHO2_02_FULL_42_9]
MEVKAKVKFIRMSPIKMRLVANLIKKLPVDKALDQLQFVNKLAARPIAKLVNSAIANAEHNFELAKDNLFIKAITVGEGPTLKRWLPRAHGRATPIRKRTSHVNLVLDEIKVSGVIHAKKQNLAAPVKLETQPKQESAVKIKESAKPEKDKNIAVKEEGKVIVDPRMEGRGGHAKIEGGSKGFVGKMFRRKSG